MKSVRLFDAMKKRLSALRQLLCIIIAIFCLAGLSSSVEAADKQSTSPKPTKAKTASNASSSPLSAGSSSGHGLAQEWEPVNELKSYKQNYLLLYAQSSQPNNLPTSPNPLNQVLVPYALDNRDMKFQISFKHVLADNQRYGSFWFAYTQLSFWQYYNVSNSRPFRETDYEPELIYSFRPNEASILNFGVVHQSNGESDPRSRSWDRVYMKPGIEFSGGGNRRLIVQVRWWLRIPENMPDDNNPDITDYLGNRDLELRYVQDGGWKVSVIARDRATQLDIAAPLASWLMLSTENSGENNVDIHFQYFNGYGESLLDYNQSHTTLGVGLSFPF
jgi:phospholipase A1